MNEYLLLKWWCTNTWYILKSYLIVLFFASEHSWCQPFICTPHPCLLLRPRHRLLQERGAFLLKKKKWKPLGIQGLLWVLGVSFLPWELHEDMMWYVFFKVLNLMWCDVIELIISRGRCFLSCEKTMCFFYLSINMDLDEQAMVGDGLFSLAYFLRLLLVARSVFFSFLVRVLLDMWPPQTTTASFWTQFCAKKPLKRLEKIRNTIDVLPSPKKRCPAAVDGSDILLTTCDVPQNPVNKGKNG